MTAPRPTPVLAIDGGGTQCRIALQRGTQVISVTTGSANVSTDFDGAVEQILEGLAKLTEKTGESVDALTQYPTFAGLAGVIDPNLAHRLRNALPFRQARIEDDRPAALRGALGAREGVIAHCGTGSFFGAQIDGGMRFSGGWGAVLGDEASAHWIGRSALSATLETVDGRTQPTGLSDALLTQFDGAAGIVRFAGSARPQNIGALAPQVTEAARQGDPLGLQVMQAGAAEVARNLRYIGWTTGRAICLTGGVGPAFEPYLPADMQRSITAPDGDPLSGALALAADLAMDPAR